MWIAPCTIWSLGALGCSLADPQDGVYPGRTGSQVVAPCDHIDRRSRDVFLPEVSTLAE